jgi:5-methylthioadenosine/S-adenosylhomocysteine deaminase
MSMPPNAAHSPTPVDAVLEASWVVPVEPTGALCDHAVVVDAGCILDVLPIPESRTRYSPRTRFELAGHVLIPGLINLHTHAAMTLMRGLADDVPLMTWLKDHIWPIEVREATAQFVADGTLLACAEMLRGGVTLFNDMYFFPEAAARSALAARMRASIGMIVVEFPSGYASDPMQYLSKGLAMRDELRDAQLLTFCLAPHAPYTVSDKTFAQVGTYAEELDIPVHIHLHETEDEIRQSLAEHHRRPLARLESLGLVGNHLIAVHAVHLTRDEIALLARYGCTVAHCPSSNMKLASGIAPVRELLAAGTNVGLGTDGAASNNRLDMFSEMRHAALLAKVTTGDPTALPAHVALEMATLNGARALGLDHRVGSLTRGKAADIVAVDLSVPELMPCYDPVSHLVYAAGRQHVRHVWVGGDLVVEDGALTHIDPRELAAKANHWRTRIRR